MWKKVEDKETEQSFVKVSQEAARIIGKTRFTHCRWKDQETSEKIRIMAGNTPIYFSDKHLKQRGPSEPIHTSLNIPRFWWCRRVSALSCQLFSAEHQGWRTLQKLPILFFLSQALLFLQVPAQQQSSSLCSLHSRAPQPPSKAGRDRGNAESRLLLRCQHSASLSDANSGSGFFVYLLFQVLCKASCSLMWQPGGPFGCSVQGWLCQGQPANRAKTENLCTKRLLLPRTIVYDWNIKEFLVTLWGRERIIC